MTEKFSFILKYEKYGISFSKRKNDLAYCECLCMYVYTNIMHV